MDLNRAAIFARVVEAQSFTLAARRLGMPKTTVSKKVSDLEAELGIRLLNRTTRSLSLTEAGGRVYAHCLPALRHLEEAEREVRSLKVEPAGMLRIGAPGAVGVPFLLPIITGLMARYPALQVSLLSINEPVDLAEDRIDVLIWPGELPQSAHRVRLVARVETALYASVDYLAAHPAPAIPEALDTHETVAFTQSLTGSRFVWRLIKGREVVEIVPKAQPRFLSNDASAVLAAAVAGQGICILPCRFADQSSDKAKLQAVLPDWRVAPLELNAFFRDGSSSSLKTRLFLDAVAEWFQLE